MTSINVYLYCIEIFSKLFFIVHAYNIIMIISIYYHDNKYTSMW